MTLNLTKGLGVSYGKYTLYKSRTKRSRGFALLLLENLKFGFS